MSRTYRRRRDRGDGRIVVQAEARQQDLEGHAVAGMREFGAVEIETDGLPGTLARSADPHEPRRRIASR